MLTEKMISTFSQSHINDFMNLNPSNGACDVCSSVVEVVRGFLLQKNGIEKFYSFLEKICKIAKINGEICSGAIKLYGNIVIDSFIKRFVDSGYLCNLLKICDNLPPYESIEDYAKRILVNIPEQKTYEKSKDTIKVVQITDTHLDMEYKEGSVANCDMTICCRDMPDKNQINSDKVILAGRYGHIGKCDANIEAVKAFAQKVKELQPAYILFTGDNVAHTVWKVTQKEVTKSTEFQIGEIRKIVGNIPIYPALGNHEKAPVDQYHGDETELLTGISNVFRQDLDDVAFETFRTKGYYSIKVPGQKNLRLISINCLLCDSFNMNLLYDSRQPNEMFRWLENELIQAENNGEFVHIQDHIPLGNHQHSKECTYRLKILLTRFKNIVKGYFSGHTHNEFLNIVHDYRTGEPIHVNYIASGLTTFTEYNPSFRMFLIDTNDYHVQDYIQYRLNLEESNKLLKPIWFNPYNATGLLNVKDMGDIKEISKFKITNEYVINERTNTPGSEKYIETDERKKYLQCLFDYDNIDEVFKCKGIKYFSEEYLYYLLCKIHKKWEKLRDN